MPKKLTFFEYIIIMMAVICFMVLLVMGIENMFSSIGQTLDAVIQNQNP